ncbi:MAG: CCA tRNA nucleotidyltransferase [Bacilli bacterium]|nr:CCA tRNA nucleotidyltransferase [Bacilli bacterium]
MLDNAFRLLKEINDHSYEAYIVGGFVRDYLLGIESNDIDICTNATPKDIREIFNDKCLPLEDYGSITVVIKGINYEITTYRKEIGYSDNRHPNEIKYINDLREDLLRRDFTINTICMDKDGNIIDYLDGKKDLGKRLIRTVGDSYTKFNEDALRILRAIRFATILNFNLDDDLKEAILKTKHLLKNISYTRKKSELDKIFNSPNFKKGIKTILDLGLDKELEISNLYKVLDSDVSSSIGIWSILNVSDKYPFNKNELDIIGDVNEVVALDNLNPSVLYKYGLYVNSVAGKIKKKDAKKIIEAYNNLIIKSRKEINVTSEEIMAILKKEPGEYLKDIYDDIEREILYNRLKNEKKSICEYIKNKYS